MRVCAVVLPELRVEVLRATMRSRPVEAPLDAARDLEASEDGALGIVVASAPLTEAKLLGHTLLDVVSSEARSLGVTEGQTIAQARARVSGLVVRVVRPEAVRRELERLAEIALSFGATVSFGEADGSSGSFGDIVWVDVTGCAHLHAPELFEGERLLATRLAGVFSELGHACAVVIADGPRIAATIARELAKTAFLPGNARRENVVVVPPGKSAVVMGRFPIASLPLSSEDARWLTKLGVHTIADLRALPRASLAARLGKRAPVVFALADGDDRAPLDAYVPPEIPEEEATFEHAIATTETLVFVVKRLTDRMASRLAGRCMAASRLSLSLCLDAALSEERAHHRAVVDLELPSPLASARDLLAALKPKVERLVLHAPLVSAKLRVPLMVPAEQVPLSLFDPTPKASLALPRLVAELAADLGETAVGRLVLGDSFIPEERTRFVRFSTKPERAPSPRRLVASAPEPTRTLDAPLPVPRETVRIVRHLGRREANAWWRQLPGARASVDDVFAWVEEAPAWVEIDRETGATSVRGWFD